MYLVFDIGGTNSRFALSVDGKTINKPKIFPTPPLFDDAMKLFEDIYLDFSKSSEIKAIAGGVTGAFNRDRTTLLNSPHLKDWMGKPLHDRLSRIVKVPVYLQNDTTLVGLGEATHGAGRGYKIVAYLTVSTGVGGVRIIDNRIDTVSYNPEPGHQIIDADGSMCPECKATEDNTSLGHLESYISGSALHSRLGIEPSEITDERIWRDIEKYLAYGLNNSIVHWTPDIVIVGGGIMNNSNISIENVKSNLKEILKIYPVHPDIIKATLSDKGGLIGSLEYLRQALPPQNVN